MFSAIFDENDLKSDDAVLDLVCAIYKNLDEDFKKEIKAKIQVINNRVLAAADRSGLSSRESFRILRHC